MPTVPFKKTKHAITVSDAYSTIIFVGNGEPPSGEEINRLVEKYHAEAITKFPGDPLFVDYDLERQ